MALPPKDGKLLYHITALDNLESIIDKGLKPRNTLDSSIVDIADEEILQCRKEFELEGQTPFHFFSLTPFSGAVQKASLETEFVYITITRSLAEYNKFSVIPKHPLNFKSEPLNWQDGINAIDWNLMNSRDYSNHECKETCMAEANFKGIIPSNLFHCIFVRNEIVQKKVKELLASKGISVNVNINKSMFLKND